MTDQTPPTDRPLTTGDVPLLNRGDILRSPARTHEVHRVWASGIALEYGEFTLSEFEASRFGFVSRPATSAASEGERTGSLNDLRVDLIDLIEGPGGYGRLTNHDGIRLQDQPAWVQFYIWKPALASPPVSERERELEGARPHIFIDCDGVLADFDTYAEDYFGMNPREYERRMGSAKFWAELEAKGDFYRNLPLMPDARELMAGVSHLSPTILTGCPRGNWAEAQKVAWAEEHFPGVPIITCRSADKRLHAKPGDVLIDDWNQHRARWIEHGGVWITHTDAETSLAALWAHYPALTAQPAGEGK